MKIQTLNNTQSKKLLELCKEFFPEYLDIFIHNDRDVRFIKQWGQIMANDPKLKKNKPTVDLYVGYYQLCLTELPKRISKKLDRKDIEPGYSIGGQTYGIDYDFSNDNEEFIKILILGNHKHKHPVDFLWNFVKECKKNKYFKNN